MIPHQHNVFLAFVDHHFEHLPAKACFVYGVLTANANEDLVCFLAPDRIAAAALLTVAAVGEALAVLAARGLVSRCPLPGCEWAVQLSDLDGAIRRAGE